MANQIEKLNKIRKYIVRGVFFGTSIGLICYLLPYLRITRINAPIGYFRVYEWASYGAGLVWFTTILIFGIIFWQYKKKLGKDPRIRSAVYDERVKLNWLKAHRFSFLAAFSITILGKIYELVFPYQLLNTSLRIPLGPQLILSIAVTALTGSFLFFNREAKNE